MRGVHVANEGERVGNAGKRGQVLADWCGVGCMGAKRKGGDGPRVPVHKTPVFGLSEVATNPFEGQIVER